MSLRELHLFAGAGGGLLASVMLGHRPVCAVEIDPYCRRVLQQRRDEGWLPAELEVHEDVCTFDGRPWRGRVDLVAGGFPCQDISVAGKGAGLEGKRSGLFYELLRVVREVGPRWVYLENVPAITGRGLDRVCGALADLGFDAEWCVLSAADAGAPHLRKRWWCLARHADGGGAVPPDGSVPAGSIADAPRSCGGNVADAKGRQGDGRERGELAGAPSTRRCGDAAAVAGGADDPDATRRGQPELRSASGQARHAYELDASPDADGGRQQVGGSRELHRGGDAPRRDADGLRAADAADAEGTRLEMRDGQRGPGVPRPERSSQADSGTGPAESRLGGEPDGLARWLDRSAAGYWRGDWETQPRLAQGQAHRVARLRALGNGQVPQTAAMAFRILMARYHQRGEA